VTAALALVTDETTDDLPEWLTTADIMYEAGITYRQCDFWARAGYLEPGRQWQGSRRGSGSPRVWPKSELEVAQRMGRLTRAGIPVPLAAFIVRESWPRAEIAPGIFIEVTAC
jgi:hypothetical protein